MLSRPTQTAAAISVPGHAWGGRACWAEIDLDVIEANAAALRRRLTPGAALMAVVKANAYGHGIAGIASAMVRGGATAFGVACVEEGIELRTAGIDLPVLILGFVPVTEAPRAVRLDLTIAVASREMAEALDAAGRATGRPAQVHIKIDTGMSRFGVQVGAAVDFVRAIAPLPGIVVRGIFTHLATADEPGSPLARAQLARFDALCRELASIGLLPGIRHACNSAGAIVYPDAQLDLVRSGVLLYGIAPGPDVAAHFVRPALSLRARIARISTIAPGACVGYGCTFRPTRLTQLALVPIGYADGLSRALSNHGRVIVRGVRAPIVGTISMDQCTVDVTDIPGAHEGDIVTLIGTDEEEEITAEDVATWRNTIPYEVLTGLPIRLPRLYLRAGAPVIAAENGDLISLS